MEEDIAATDGNGAGAKSAECEAVWIGHVAAAEKFSGSTMEYCRLHGLNRRAFRAYRKKFGTPPMRGRQPKAFLKIETGELESPAMAPRSRLSNLPDPRWTAEFLAALLAALR